MGRQSCHEGLLPVPWCSTCLLLKIVSALPHLPKCSCCNCELSTVQSTDFEDNGDTVVRTATFRCKYTWQVGPRVRAWLKKPADERKGGASLVASHRPRIRASGAVGLCISAAQGCRFVQVHGRRQLKCCFHAAGAPAHKKFRRAPNGAIRNTVYLEDKF